jgi:3-hydroxypropanoate dehydrogenase
VANTQPLRVLYVRTPEDRGRLVAHMDEGNRAKTLAAPAVAVLARDLRFHEHIPTVMPVKPDLEQALEAGCGPRTAETGPPRTVYRE